MNNYTNISTEALIKMRSTLRNEESVNASKLEEEINKELAERFRGFEATLSQQIKDEFIANGFEACEDTFIQISGRSLEIGLCNRDPKRPGWKFTFASTFDWYLKDGINVGTSGTFNPSNADSYWRTIHAASILKNYDKLQVIAKKYCKLYNEEENRYFN
jgi:hypothetical protein